MASTCKKCGAPIVWIKTPGGKSMPCDADPITYWEENKARGKIVTPNGDVISCKFEGDPQNATGIGYKPHWATCPFADSFRKKGGRDDGR